VDTETEGARKRSWTLETGQWSLGAGLDNAMLRPPRGCCSDWRCAEWCHPYVTASLPRPLKLIDITVAVFSDGHIEMRLTVIMVSIFSQCKWFFYERLNKQARMAVHCRHKCSRPHFTIAQRRKRLQ